MEPIITLTNLMKTIGVTYQYFQISYYAIYPKITYAREL